MLKPMLPKAGTNEINGLFKQYAVVEISNIPSRKDNWEYWELVFEPCPNDEFRIWFREDYGEDWNFYYLHSETNRILTFQPTEDNKLDTAMMILPFLDLKELAHTVETIKQPDGFRFLSVDEDGELHHTHCLGGEGFFYRTAGQTKAKILGVYEWSPK